MMKIYIALLRGINVGGNNALPMRELVKILEDLGAQTVQTYIQSGNAVFASAERDNSQLADSISQEIKQRRGFEPRVLLLDREELERVIENNPFPEATNDPTTLHVGFLTAAPKRPDLGLLERLRRNGERCLLVNTVFYLHAPEGIGRSKLAANTERLLGVPMTDRNWRTVCKLQQMARALTL